MWARRRGSYAALMRWSLLIAADLVPAWFAAAFWLAFIALVALVVRDVRRAGGIRRVMTALDEAINRQGAERRRPDDADVDPVNDDPTRRPD